MFKQGVEELNSVELQEFLSVSSNLKLRDILVRAQNECANALLNLNPNDETFKVIFVRLQMQMIVYKEIYDTLVYAYNTITKENSSQLETEETKDVSAI